MRSPLGGEVYGYHAMSGDDVMKTVKRSFLPFGLALAFTALVIGCGDDNPVDDNAHEHHLEAFGVRLYDGDNLLVEADGVDVTGAIDLAVGDTTSWLSIQFKDEDGEWYAPAEHIEEGEEDVFVLDAEVTGDHAEALVGSYDDGTEWTVRFAGLGEGNDVFRVMTIHEGHEDYVSPELTLNVGAAQ